MGSYGIGVSRLVAVIAEQHHDELGIAAACLGLAVRRRCRDRQQGRSGPARAPNRWPPISACATRSCLTTGPLGRWFKDAERRRPAHRGGRPRLGGRRGGTAQPIHRREPGDRGRRRRRRDRRRARPASFAYPYRRGTPW